MIIRNLTDLIGTERDVDWGNGSSRRFLIERDKMNFSLTDTVCKAGSISLLEYKNHLEACYCIAGEGEIHNPETGEVHPITPGSMYALDKHDRHYLIARDELRLICVFQPALRGDESHRLREDGSSTY